MKVSSPLYCLHESGFLYTIYLACVNIYTLYVVCVCFRFTRSFSFSVAVGVFVGLVGVCVDVTKAERSAIAGYLQCAAAGLLSGAAAYADTPGSF